MEDYELHLFGFYAARVHDGLPERGELRGDFLEMCERQLRRVGDQLPKPGEKPQEEGDDDESSDGPSTLVRLRELAVGLDACAPSRIETSVRELSETFGLEGLTQYQLGVLSRWYFQAWESPTRAIIDFLNERFDEPGGAELPGMTVTTIRLMFGIGRHEALNLSTTALSALAARGIAVPNGTGVSVTLSGGILRALTGGDTSRETMLEYMADHAAADGPAPKWTGFSHLGAQRKLVSNLVETALDNNAKGLSMLIMGDDRELRLAFARSLARRHEARLVVLNARRMADSAPERRESEAVAAWVLRADWLLRGQRAIVAVDWADDGLCDRPNNNGEAWLEGKGRWHPRRAHERLLQAMRESSAPVLWLGTDAKDLFDGVAGQMAAAVQLSMAPAPVRREAWQSELDGTDAEQVAALSSAYDGFPWEAEGAVRALRMVGANDKGMREALQSVAAIRRGRKPSSSPAQDQEFAFDPALVSADHDLAAMLDQLTQEDAPRAFSLLLSGPPGTGKSQWVRELAARLGLAVEMKRASALLGKYVGESEKAIASAFQEAEAAGSFLVFDEADSLLWNRERAQQGWQVSQVNEMLTWMERHPLPFACTTNLSEAVDQASLRRFTFKVAFNFMSAPQIRAAFLRFFSVEAPRRATNLSNLTPGDFAVVRKRAAILRALQDPERLTDMLELESHVKPGSKAPIGFGANSR